MGGGVRVLEAAALVHGDVHEHGALLHLQDHLVGDDVRGLAARDQHRADHQIGLEHAVLDLVGGRDDRAHAVAVEVVHGAQSLDRGVQHGDVGAHADQLVHRIATGLARPDDGGLRRAHTGDPGQQQAAPAVGGQQRVRADGGGHAAGDLGHGREQRQRAAVALHGLVGQRRGAGVQQRLGQLAAGGQMQVREQREVIAQEAVLGGDRLLDLQHELRRPGLLDGHEDGAGVGVLLVRDAGADPGALLDADLVAVAHQLMDAGRGEGHTALLRLGLRGDSDDHVRSLRSGHRRPRRRRRVRGRRSAPPGRAGPAGLSSARLRADAAWPRSSPSRRPGTPWPGGSAPRSGTSRSS